MTATIPPAVVSKLPAPVVSTLPISAKTEENVNVKVKPTLLAKATFGAGLSPRQAVWVLKLLTEAQTGGLVLTSTLHLCYYLTPAQSSVQPHWKLYYQIYLRLAENLRSIAERIGVSEAFLSHAQTTPVSSKHALYQLHRRFYNALILHELVSERNLGTVAYEWGYDRGAIQQLQPSAASFAGMLSIFCERLRWRNLALLVSHHKERLDHGVSSELLPLIQLDHVKAFRARALFNSGLTTVNQVALAGVDRVKRVLQEASPFLSSSQCSDVRVRAEETQMWRTARMIVASAQELSTQDA